MSYYEHDLWDVMHMLGYFRSRLYNTHMCHENQVTPYVGCLMILYVGMLD